VRGGNQISVCLPQRRSVARYGYLERGDLAVNDGLIDGAAAQDYGLSIGRELEVAFGSIRRQFQHPTCDAARGRSVGR
jgi:hypothetical protein